MSKKLIRWNEELVIEKLDEMLEIAMTTDVFYVTSVAVKVGLYKKWLSHQRDRFKDCEEIQEKMYRLYDICESRIVDLMLRNKISQQPAIFMLRSNYGMIEAQPPVTQTPVQHSGQIEIVFNDPKPLKKKPGPKT